MISTGDATYKILVTGYDVLGKSEIKGFLTVVGEKMEIKLLKEYDDYCEFVNSEMWTEVEYHGKSSFAMEWEGTWWAVD